MQGITQARNFTVLWLVQDIILTTTLAGQEALQNSAYAKAKVQERGEVESKVFLDEGRGL